MGIFITIRDGYFRSAFIRLGLDPERIGLSESTKADFQCNGAHAAAKVLGCSAVQAAERIRDAVMGPPLINHPFTLEVTEKGWINVHLTDAGIFEDMKSLRTPGGHPEHVTEPVLIDFGGPNIAKPMHVGHLRSLIIGDSLAKIINVVQENYGDQSGIRDIHLGDWGLQMGLLIAAIHEPTYEGWAYLFEGGDEVTIDLLQQLYPLTSARSKNDPEFLERAQIATSELQRGKLTHRVLWEKFRSVTIADVKRDLSDLGIEFDLWLGESDAEPLIPEIIDMLVQRGIAVESDGALIVPLGDDGPLILRNSKGSALYATTDLATLIKRTTRFWDSTDSIHAKTVLYVVDQRQDLHFKKVFAVYDIMANETMGVPRDVVHEHLGFGTVNGPDGKPLKTRAGGVPTLRSLIESAKQKALERMPDRPEDASKIAIAAIKFADLQNNRSSSYVFDLEKFLSFEGKTGPYICYQYVRIKSIYEKFTYVSDRFKEEFSHPLERALAVALLAYPRNFESAYAQRRPDFIATHVYNLAQAFSRFYAECKIENDPLRRHLTHLTLKQFSNCLNLLGIVPPDKM